MERLLQAQPATLTASWERDGVATDPAAGVTVTVTRDSDGSTVLSSAATTGSPGTSRSVTLTPAQTAKLDSLTCKWTAVDGSVLTTYAEVVGGFLFSVAQARRRSPLEDATAYPTDQVILYRTLAEMALEDICGVSFVPRYSRANGSIATWGLLTVPRRKITKVLQITTMTDAGPQAVPSLAGVRIESGASIFMPTFWNFWSLPIQVAFEHGYLETPPRVGRAALELARRWLVESPWDERTTGFRTRDGGEMSILTASNRDPFDIPEVVAVAEQYGTPMIG